MADNVISLDKDTLLEAAARQTGLTIDQIRDEWEAIEPPMLIPDKLSDPRLQARRKAEAAQVPEIHISNVVDKDPDECESLSWVRRFLADHERRFLILSGDYGIRKSGSACWSLSVQDGAYARSTQLVDNSIRFKDRHAKLETAKLIVLDDLGREFFDQKHYWKNIFNELIDAWYSACAKVIVTTNLTLVQFRERYEERTLRRIRERGWFKTVR